MDRNEVLDLFRNVGALLEGHFILSSGLRSPVFLQCALVLSYPQLADRLASALAKKVKSGITEPIDCVVSPAMGGVIIGQEMGRALDVRAMFTERVDGVFTFRRGFQIPKAARVLMVEDVVTTGLSSRECISTISSAGGEVVAAACLINRSGGTANVGVPLVALAEIDAPTYRVEDVPPELAAIDPIKPGSRPGMR
ncbi:MAG: orotate phosphoribosyltransferase [Pseudomonadota bacterium]